MNPTQVKKGERIFPPPAPGGKGWGDGSLVEAYTQRRTSKPENTYTGFRPRIGPCEGAFYVIRNWCRDKRVRRSFSALFNSLMIGLKTACENTTEVDEDGRVSIEVNLGRIYIE